MDQPDEIPLTEEQVVASIRRVFGQEGELERYLVRRRVLVHWSAEDLRGTVELCSGDVAAVEDRAAGPILPNAQETPLQCVETEDGFQCMTCAAGSSCEGASFILWPQPWTLLPVVVAQNYASSTLFQAGVPLGEIDPFAQPNPAMGRCASRSSFLILPVDGQRARLVVARIERGQPLKARLLCGEDAHPVATEYASRFGLETSCAARSERTFQCTEIQGEQSVVVIAHAIFDGNAVIGVDRPDLVVEGPESCAGCGLEIPSGWEDKVANLECGQEVDLTP